MAIRVGATPIPQIPRVKAATGTDLLTLYSNSNQAAGTITVSNFIADLGILTDSGTGPNIINLNNNSTLTAQQVQDTDIVFCDSSSTAFSVQLPSIASLPAGESISFKKNTSVDNDVTILAAGGDTIDGDPSLILSGTTYPSAQLVSDGVAWFVFSA